METPDRQPLKVAEVPSAFIWRGRRYTVRRLVRQWTAFRPDPRRGRGGRPLFAIRGGKRSSWGVGRTYFRLETGDGVYDLYYDRRPERDRLGGWYLWRRVD